MNMQSDSKIWKICSDILIAASILVIAYFHFSQGDAHPFEGAHVLLLLILPLMFFVIHRKSKGGDSMPEGKR